MASPGFWERCKDALLELWFAAFAWVPTPLGTGLRMLAWRPFFKSCGNVRFASFITVQHPENIIIGNGCRIGRGVFLTASEGALELGENVSISPNVNVGADHGKIVIGANSAIGPGTVVRGANHRFASRKEPIIRQGHEYGEVVIGEDVWIGANCVITPNTHIGAGAIVGAGSVATRDIAPYSIAAGCPAQKIGERP